MKIGFLGNANNYPFMLARAMQRLGHEVLFIVDKTVAINRGLHRPECRYDDITLPYPNWIVDASPLDLFAFPPPWAKRVRIVSVLRQCDAVVLNESGICLASSIRRPAIVLLTGADLTLYAQFAHGDWLAEQFAVGHFSRARALLGRYVLKPYYRRLALTYRQSIGMAKGVYSFARNLVPKGDLILDEIGVSEEQKMFFLLADTVTIRPRPIPQNPIVRVFCVARFNWDKSARPFLGNELDYKGSDIMIRGIGLFFRKTGVHLDLRFPRKGEHLSQTLKLIREEGITSQVTWIDEMPQKGVFQQYAQADIVFDQMANSFVGMGGLEAMAAGRPLIANGRPEIMERFIGEPSPICQAATAEEVCVQLERLVTSREERERVGLQSRCYVEKHFSPDHAARLCLEKLKPSCN